VFSSGLLNAQKALEYERVKTYWQIGKAITAAVAASRNELQLNEALYLKISRDLNRQLRLELSVDALGRTVQFYKNYPRFPEKTTLTFTHYLALQRLPDPRLRLQLERAAIKKNMSVLEIKDEIARIKAGAVGAPSAGTKTLECRRGEPYVYYIRPEKGLDGKEIFRIDCGFKINTDIPPQTTFTPDQSRVVRSVKENETYKLHFYKQGADKVYTYAARVIRVVDGDTIDACIDVGFGIGLSDRLRFKGIDSPEAETAEGRQAGEFLEDYLARCPLIVIRSFKSEIYGRWLADVFALPGADDPCQIAAEGEYLNQVLLDEGMAMVYL